MGSVDPVVRYLIVCEDVRVDPQNLRRVDILGLVSSIRALDDPPFPLLYEELCVFLQLTACRGPADGHVQIRHADSDAVVFRSQTRRLALGVDPLEVVGMAFRLRDVQFPLSGLYWVEFWYNGRTLAQQALVLR